MRYALAAMALLASTPAHALTGDDVRAYAATCPVTEKMGADEMAEFYLRRWSRDYPKAIENIAICMAWSMGKLAQAEGR